MDAHADRDNYSTMIMIVPMLAIMVNDSLIVDFCYFDYDDHDSNVETRMQTSSRTWESEIGVWTCGHIDM